MKEVEVLIKQILRSIQKSADISVCILIASSGFCECSRKGIREEWNDEIEQLKNNYDPTYEIHNDRACSFKCTIGEEIVCDILMDREHREFKEYIKTLIGIAYESYAQKKKNIRELSNRRMLVNRLIGEGTLSEFEINTVFRTIKCRQNLSRCAVLLYINLSENETNEIPITDLVENFGYENNYLTKEDVCGSFEQHIVIFMETESFASRKNRERVEGVCCALMKYIRSCFGEHAVSCALIGSVYADARQLYKSFREVKYLYSNFEYYSRYQKDCYFINDYVFEYLYSRLNDRTQEMMIRDFKVKLEKSKILDEIMAPMAINNMKLKDCARELGIHINTMQQRYQKMKEEMRFDPLNDMGSRAMVHIYVVQENKKTIWNAGVIVQENSVLFRGIQNLSTIINRKSSGTFQINVHSVAVSGDNLRLFGMLNEGMLDIAVGSTIALKHLVNPKFSVLQYPFLFDSEEEAEYVLQTLVIPEIQNSLNMSGLLCVDIWSMGWRHLTSKNTPVRIPADMKGKKIRILASDDIQTYFEKMDALPVQIYYNNITDAMSSDLIECQDNPYSNIWGMKIYEYQKYITEMTMFYSMEACCVSQKSWYELDKEKKVMLNDAISENSNWLKKEQRRMNQNAKEKLLKEGLTVIIPTESEINLWKEKSIPMYEKTKYKEFLTRIMDMKAHYSKNKMLLR